MAFLGIRTVLVLLGGCGRLGFDAAGVPATHDAAGDAPAVAQIVSMTAQEFTGPSVDVTIEPTAPGSLLVVAFTTWNTGSPVTTITAGSEMTRAAAPAIDSGISSELWYSSPPAGTSAVTVTLDSASGGFDVWTAEFSNVAAGPPAEIAMGCLQYPPALAVAEVTTTTPNELVFGVTMFAAPIYVDGVDAPFTGLAYPTGNGAAYTVATQPGSYGPQFQIAMGEGMGAATCATTARFLPAP